MQRMVRLAAGVAALALAAESAAAQDTTDTADSTGGMPASEGFFGKPAFVLMPGVVMTPVLSGYGDGDAGDTKTYFNARFMTVVPTRLPWLQTVAGVQWQPNSPRNASGQRQNYPGVFYGALIPFAPITKATDGWLSLSLDPLGVYSAGGGGSADDNVYGHDFVLEGAAVINIGQKMMTRTPFFGNTSIYVLLDQFITNRPEDANGDKDYWSPIALAGVVIPIGR